MIKQSHITVGLHLNKNTHIPIKAVELLAAESGLSNQQVKTAMKKGGVWLEDNKGVRRLRRADSRPNHGSKLHLYYNEDVLALIPPKPTLIADHKEYSIWYKPSGMLSQGSKWSDHCTLNRWIETNAPFEMQAQRNCFMVHRLDKAACGLMLIAHTKTAAAKLSGLFAARKINKHYRVVVEGEFPENGVTVDSPIDNKPALSFAKKLEYNREKNRSLLDVKIESGRKHQIRIHLSNIAYPIVGDRLHGIAKDKEESLDLQLAAFSLEFTCPFSLEERYYKLAKDLSLTL